MLQTVRQGGVSGGSYASLNLGDHVGDDAAAVAANRERVLRRIGAQPLWLQQVHGATVAIAETAASGVEADAAIARMPNRACVVMTADCLPVLLCDRAGTAVAAVHAGWRGLCAGIIERTVTAMRIPGEELLAWLGPAIGADVFEVGAEVRSAFMTHSPEAVAAFAPAKADKWLADIGLLARQRLYSVGVTAIYGGGWCTVTEPDRFFSYRRDGITGRMATFIWLKHHSKLQPV
ncbi:MAG: peptidoglycan editing factor PgeF [Betaproteobacteria bacterium]